MDYTQCKTIPEKQGHLKTISGSKWLFTDDRSRLLWKVKPLWGVIFCKESWAWGIGGFKQESTVDVWPGVDPRLVFSELFSVKDTEYLFKNNNSSKSCIMK